MNLSALVAERRILVCVGAGGVGKTTTAASLGLAAARAGRRTLVLTIDPARRLANALGLDTLGHEERRVPDDKIALAGEKVPGTLHAMMLDQQRSFDEIVERYASDSATRDRILQNRIYRQISSRLSGAHEYAALSKLYDLAASQRYDLIILDTPPTSNALDFLEAPERISTAIESPAIKWLVKPYLSGGRFSWKAVGVGAAFVLTRLARFVGSAFLEDMAQFFVEFDGVLAGFHERARVVFELLRKPECAFILIASPEPAAIDEALFFQQRLVQTQMPLGAFVINRVHPVRAAAPTRELLIDTLTARPELHGWPPDDVVRVAADLDRTYREFQALAEIDRRQVERLRRLGPTPLVEVPLFDNDVYDVTALLAMADRLTGPTA